DALEHFGTEAPIGTQSGDRRLAGWRGRGGGWVPLLLGRWRGNRVFRFGVSLIRLLGLGLRRILGYGGWCGRTWLEEQDRGDTTEQHGREDGCHDAAADDCCRDALALPGIVASPVANAPGSPLVRDRGSPGNRAGHKRSLAAATTDFLAE